MSLPILIKAVLFSMIPIAELRGSLPYAYFNGIPLPMAFFITVLSNFTVSFLIFVFLDYINSLLLHVPIYKKIFTNIIERSRKKLEGHVTKYGYLGLALFVGIPLPFTGIWTGALGAWVLNLDRKKTYFYLFLGVLMAGIIVSLICYFGLTTYQIFIKKI